MERWRNYGLWVSIFAFIPLIMDSFGYKGLIPTNYEEVTKAFLQILVLAGIVSNPNAGKWFTDKED